MGKRTPPEDVVQQVVRVEEARGPAGAVADAVVEHGAREDDDPTRPQNRISTSRDLSQNWSLALRELRRTHSEFTATAIPNRFTAISIMPWYRCARTNAYGGFWCSACVFGTSA